MELKPYQKAALGVLKRFLDDARISGPKAAFAAITSDADQRKRLGAYAGPYAPLNGMEETPYVCMRLPTGGGKTILASHAIDVARKAVAWRDYPLVLWLTPSNIIRTQTAEALKNPRHPYRAAMDEAFGGRVRVFDIADFTTIRPQDLRDNLCVVVSTIQTLRVDKTEGRNVYKHHEELETHFSAVPPTAEGLEKSEDGKIKFSFVNLLHFMQPLMIVDEAHNAVTGLSREMQSRVNPCAIIEFTATPAPKSNVLHSVSAQEVKAAGMIKLPIMLAEHPDWQDAVSGAIQTRARLAETAEKDARYIRPIVLFQAQPKDETVTVDVLHRHLTDVEGIDRDRIAIATGDQRGLDGIDLFDRATRIDFIITQQALKEGWDCSFAYVFCSVAKISSGKDVEQLLGRVLRMPYAEPRAKDLDALNRAYAHVSEPNFSAAANALRDRLIGMGFEEKEAEDAIESLIPQRDADEGLFGRRPPPAMTFTAPSSAAVQALAKKQGVRLVAREDGAVDIEISCTAFEDVRQAVEDALPQTERGAFREKAATFSRETLSPAERREAFRVAALGAVVEDQLTFDLDEIEEYFDWALADHPARLEAGEFSVAETANRFSLDLDGKTVNYRFVGEDPQSSFGFPEREWTREKLALWLDGETRRIDVAQTDNLAWITRLLSDLIERRKLSLAGLMRGKYALARKISDKLTQFRREHRAGVYQQAFFRPEARLEVSFDHGFTFRAGMYDGVRMYPGHPYRFSKHFLGPRQVPAFDGTGVGEEFECAKALDSLPQVKFWLRLVKQHPASIWLPTSTDRFYPDFVAELNDGRTFLIEYKGADRIDNADTAEKRAIGELWARQSGGLFLVVGKEVDGLDPRRQMLARIGS